MIVGWIIVAAVAIAAAWMVIRLDNPVHSALSLVLTLLCVAVMYAMLNAPFLSIVQVAVYAGAIMVLFLFVIMLLNLRREEGGVQAPRVVRAIALVLGAIVVVGILSAVFTAPFKAPALGSGLPSYNFGSPQAIGKQLFDVYLIPFEATSLLLTVAMVGAILLARRKF